MKESSAMKTSKNDGKSLVCLLKVGLGLGLGLGAAGNVQGNGISPETVVQNFSKTTLLQASPLAPLPTINEVWNIQPYAGIPTDLVCVKLEITTQLMYDGMLVSQLANRDYIVQVRSDFTVDFGGTKPGTITDLDPVVLMGGQAPGTPQTLFEVSKTQAANQTVTLGTTPSELVPYRTGTVPVFVTANLRTDATGLTGYDNTSDLGPASPAAFVNDPKVMPSFGAQLYELKTTLIVTYFVPETGAPLAALAALGLGWFFLRRRVR